MEQPLIAGIAYNRDEAQNLLFGAFRTSPVWHPKSLVEFLEPISMWT
ncbi:MAG: hypothetical protein Ct9H300mP16_17740 [Pseudomonadota bacterium]|nr:MAG: hypothetical protein Ct9H300mP16_17740 [Pseudomonadota bacterium]